MCLFRRRKRKKGKISVSIGDKFICPLDDTLGRGKLGRMAKMGKKIGTEKIKRESGYLYYVGKDGYVWKTPMKVNKKGKKAKVGTEKINRKPGYMYYVDSAGFVCEAKMKNA